MNYCLLQICVGYQFARMEINLLDFFFRRISTVCGEDGSVFVFDTKLRVNLQTDKDANLANKSQDSKSGSYKKSDRKKYRSKARIQQDSSGNSDLPTNSSGSDDCALAEPSVGAVDNHVYGAQVLATKQFKFEFAMSSAVLFREVELKQSFSDDLPSIPGQFAGNFIT